MPIFCGETKIVLNRNDQPIETEDADADDPDEKSTDDDAEETDENSNSFFIKMVFRPEKANTLLFFAGTGSNYLGLYIKNTKRLGLM